MSVDNSDNIWALHINFFVVVTQFGCHLFFVKAVVKELLKARIMLQGIFLSKLLQDSSELVAWKSMLSFPRSRSAAKKAELQVLKFQIKLLSISLGNVGAWKSCF